MNKITSALFIVFASIALAMPAYTQDFKLEQEQLREITNNLEQLNENQLQQRKAYLLQQLENNDGGSISGSSDSALTKLNLMWVELNIIEKILAVGATGVVLDNLFGDEDKDSTAPVITLNGSNPTTVELGNAYIEAGATADTGELVSVSGTVNTNAVGTYILTYTAIDDWANVGTATRTVNVVDTTSPVMSVTGDNPATVELGASYSDAGATGSDLGGVVTVTSSGTVNTDAVGTYTITYTGTDPSGNTATATRTVNVVDTTAPVITVSGSNPASVELGDTYTDAGATATDLSGSITVTTNGTVNADAVGTYTLTYIATDPSGNTATATRTVNVVDTTAPAVTVTGDNPASVELGDTYTDAGATATDLSGVVTVVTTGTVDTDTVGSYTLTYTSTDPSGNAGTATRTVNVVDTTAPVVTVTGTNPVTHELGDTYTDAGATATDASGTVTVVTTGSVNPKVVGEYTKTYTSTDASGNVGTATRTVNVVDTTGPTITLTGGTPFQAELSKTGSFTEPGFSTSDNAATAITESVTGSVDLSVLGEYTRIYTATDVSGNSTSVTRIVNVVDTTAPTITILGDNPRTVEADQGGTYTDPGVTAEDEDSNALTFDTSSTVDLGVVGSYVFTHTVTDQSGNAASAERTVTVVDTTAPNVTLVGSNPLTVEAADGTSYNDPGATANDNAASAMTKSETGTVDMGVVGSYEVEISYTDASGNVSLKKRTVNVIDTTPPVITGDALVNTEVSQTAGSYTMEPGITASDNSATTLTKTESNTVNIAVLGGYTDTTTFTDESGNSSTLTRVVRVVDTTAPTVTVLGEAVVLVIQYGSYTESGATAVDNSAGPLEKGILGTVDVSTVGDYTLTYTFTDLSGNVGSATRLVEVRPAGTTETGTSTFSTGTGTSTSSATSTGG